MAPIKVEEASLLIDYTQYSSIDSNTVVGTDAKLRCNIDTFSIEEVSII